MLSQLLVEIISNKRDAEVGRNPPNLPLSHLVQRNFGTNKVPYLTKHHLRFSILSEGQSLCALRVGTMTAAWSDADEVQRML